MSDFVGSPSVWDEMAALVWFTSSKKNDLSFDIDEALAGRITEFFIPSTSYDYQISPECEC